MCLLDTISMEVFVSTASPISLQNLVGQSSANVLIENQKDLNGSRKHWLLERSKFLFNHFGHEFEEAASVLIGFHGGDAVNVRAVLHSLGSFGRLFFHAVMRQDVDQSQKVDLTSRSICNLKELLILSNTPLQ